MALTTSAKGGQRGPAGPSTFAAISAAVQTETGATLRRRSGASSGDGGLEGVSENGVTVTVIPEKSSGTSAYRIFRVVAEIRVTAVTPFIAYSYTIAEGHRVSVSSYAQAHELTPAPGNDADYERRFSAQRLVGGSAVQRLASTAIATAEVVGPWSHSIQLNGNAIELRVDTAATTTVDFIVDAEFRDWTFPTS